MAQLGTFTPQPSRGEGDMWKPKEHFDVPVIIKVKKWETGVITENAPEGTDAITVDLVDLSDGVTYRDVLMFGGGVCDGLKPYIDQAPMVIKFDRRQSKSGRFYPVPVPGEPNEVAYARQWLDQHGDPFIPTLDDARLDEGAAPAATPPPWQRQAS